MSLCAGLNDDGQRWTMYGGRWTTEVVKKLCLCCHMPQVEFLVIRNVETSKLTMAGLSCFPIQNFVIQTLCRR